MDGVVTYRSLIERAIVLERSVCDLYRHLADAFTAHDAISEFWRAMAIDESAHEELLRSALAHTPAAQLALPVPECHAHLVPQAERELDDALAETMRTLDDAFEMAHRIESSEVNRIVELVLAGPLETDVTRALIRSQFDEHLGRLYSFGRQHDRALRRSIAMES